MADQERNRQLWPPDCKRPTAPTATKATSIPFDHFTETTLVGRDAGCERPEALAHTRS